MKSVATRPLSSKVTKRLEEQRGGFVEGSFGKCALVPAFLYRRSVFGTLNPVFLYRCPFFVPRSGFWGPGNIRQNHPFGNRPFANPRKVTFRVSTKVTLWTRTSHFRVTFGGKKSILSYF